MPLVNLCLIFLNTTNMSDSTHLNSLYDKLFASVENLFKTEELIKADKVEIDSLVDFLSQNETEIGKFKNATLELQILLDKYDFTNEDISIFMNSIRKKVESLHPLRSKLVKMGEEAKLLSVFPDRYNSKKSIETCRTLFQVCRERLRFDELDKVSQVVETNTQKLIEIRKLIERDNDNLRQINNAIDANKMVLEKFKAYYTELQQFVSEFPHSGQDDYAVVTKRISAAKSLMALYIKADKEVFSIKDFCDRHNKGMIVANYQTTIQAMFTSMKHSDVNWIEVRLNDIAKQVNAVHKAFDAEHHELDALMKILKAKKTDLWKEDNESLLTTVSGLLNNDTRKSNFDINHLKNSYSHAKSKRLSDIANTKKTYPWLESRKRYKIFHDRIISKYIESIEYHTIVEKLKKDKLWRTILLFIPILGWIILFNMEEVSL